MFRHGFFCIVGLLAVTFLKAQVFGGNPSSTKWRQINSDTVRVIFPKGSDSVAQRVASIVYELQKNHTKSIGNKLRKVDIVLQNQNTISNAYVALGPYRSEFYLFSPQNSFDLGSLSWADNLSLHEYRHVQQYSNFNVGLSKLASIILGQEGQAVANAAAVPDWFFEGDAVFNETILSNQGRGRVPAFFDGYQSLLKSGRLYSYMKLRNGSFRDYVPDHYNLGYLLVAYGREKYGEEFWKKVTHDAAAFRSVLYPWQAAIKKYSGVSYKQFLKGASSYYAGQWNTNKVSEPSYLTRLQKNNVVDYKYPYEAEDGNVIALKRSYRRLPAFYILSSAGREQKIAIQDITYDDYFSYNNGKIIYSTLNPDIRWGNKESSDLRILDVRSKQKKVFALRKRYFAPDISHSGDLVVAVEMDTHQQSMLVLMTTEGKVITRLPGIGNVFTHPKFSANDDAVFTAVRNKNGEMALQKWNIKDKVGASVETLLPFSNRIIGFPTVNGDTVLFSSAYKGSDEIWAFLLKKNEVYRVATGPTGFYQAIFDSKNDRLITSAFTANGYRLANIPASNLLWQKVDRSANALPDVYVPTALNQESNETLKNVPVRNFNTSIYHKGSHLFNFHSWRPYYDRPEYSFTVFGQNILNTFQSEFSYTYNSNEKSHTIAGSGIYGGWFVQPFLSVSKTFHRSYQYSRDSVFHSDEMNASVGAALPLDLSGGKQYRSLSFNTSLNYKEVKWNDVAKRYYSNSNFNYWQGQLTYVGQIQKGVQNIYPHWAQSLLLRYRTIINNYKANQLLLSGSLYLPGAFTNHSLVVNAAFHSRDTLRQYLFSNSFPFSRGYNSVDFPRAWKIGLNYHFPIAYPDAGFANIVYLLRIRGNAFYDHTVAKSLRTGTTFPYRSVGGELYFDTKWWNEQPVSFGVRYSRLLDDDFLGGSPNQWEFILPVNLF